MFFSKIKLVKVPKTTISYRRTDGIDEQYTQLARNTNYSESIHKQNEK